jgi:coniferyl-alcohol glucosyltransferase
MGHQIPVQQLANHLITHHQIPVTVLIVTTHTSPPESHPTTTSSSNLLRIVQLPPVDVSSLLDPTATVVTRLCVMMRAALPSVRSALLNSSPRPNFLIADLFGSESFKIADELGMPKYVYITSNAWYACLTTYCDVLDKEVVGQYVDQTEVLRIPGCKPIRPEDVVDPMLDRNDQQYREFVRIGVEYSFFRGILLNTWEDLDRRSVDALRSIANVPIYPIGPLTKAAEPEVTDTELMEWLDKQPGESVLYVSFGSGGTLSGEQLTELAWGLEMSQQRFVWVVRPPVRGHADASFFSSGNGASNGAVADFLPDGFMDKTRNLGLIVPMWAPQMKILSHPSVGGFLSHCGWNSTLESLVNGVPIIVWPLYAEQRMNATFLAEELGVAVRPKVLPTKEVVRREEIEEMVRSVMELERGKGMRERVKELKVGAEKALSKGGSSYNSLCEMIKDCRMRLESR